MNNHQPVGRNNRHRVTEVACCEKTEKFIPSSISETPKGNAWPGRILNASLVSSMLRACSFYTKERILNRLEKIRHPYSWAISNQNHRCITRRLLQHHKFWELTERHRTCLFSNEANFFNSLFSACYWILYHYIICSYSCEVC